MRYTIEEIEDEAWNGSEDDVLRAMLRQLLAENDVLKAANSEWEEKTRWVCGAEAKPSELGMHRADVLKQRIDAAKDDADRYKWLSEQHWVEPEAVFRLDLSDTDDFMEYKRELAEAIDAARKKGN